MIEEPSVVLVGNHSSTIAVDTAACAATILRSMKYVRSPDRGRVHVEWAKPNDLIPGFFELFWLFFTSIYSLNQGSLLKIERAIEVK